MRRWYRVGGSVLLVLISAQNSLAGSIGIPLDAFLALFQQWVIGLGFVVGLVGLLGWVASLLSNPFSHMLAGAVNYFVAAGLLGGGTILLGMMGLIGGATLP